MKPINLAQLFTSLTKLAGAVTLSVCMFPASAQKWDFYTFMPSPIASTKRLAIMLEDINKETGGQLAVRMHMGGSLQISTTNITQAVSDNVVQMAEDSFFTGNIPVSGLLRLPLLIRTDDEFQKATKVIDPLMDAAYKKRGVIMLGRYNFPPQVLWSNKKLTSLADLKGQKLRVTSPEQAEFLKRFGAASVTIGPPEVAPALERGVIEGVLTASSGGGVAWKDVLKYNYRLGVNYVDAVVIVNAESFGKLPAASQEKVRKITAAAMPEITAALRSDEVTLTKKFAAEGIVVTEPSAQEVNEVGAQFPDYWQSWAKTRGPEAIEALTKIRALLGR